VLLIKLFLPTQKSFEKTCLPFWGEDAFPVRPVRPIVKASPAPYGIVGQFWFFHLRASILAAIFHLNTKIKGNNSGIRCIS